MLRKKPTFKATSVLARYIYPEFRHANGRPATGAYQRKVNEDHLSVNSTEVETIKQIAQTYAEIFESSFRPVAVAAPIVADYNESAKKVGVTISQNSTSNDWKFQDTDELSVAYRHRGREGNRSHCGVEFVRAFSDIQDFKFAVRIKQTATYKMV